MMVGGFQRRFLIYSSIVSGRLCCILVSECWSGERKQKDVLRGGYDRVGGGDVSHPCSRGDNCRGTDTTMKEMTLINL